MMNTPTKHGAKSNAMHIGPASPQMLDGDSSLDRVLYAN